MQRPWGNLVVWCAVAAQNVAAPVCSCAAVGALLGSGSFGRVYKARWKEKDVAVKVRYAWCSSVQGWRSYGSPAIQGCSLQLDGRTICKECCTGLLSLT